MSLLADVANSDEGTRNLFLVLSLIMFVVYVAMNLSDKFYTGYQQLIHVVLGVALGLGFLSFIWL